MHAIEEIQKSVGHRPRLGKKKGDGSLIKPPAVGHEMRLHGRRTVWQLS
jgi:hypothetical protein